MKNEKIVDIHAHIFPQKIASKAVESIGKFYESPMLGEGTISDLLQSGSKVRIYKYVVHSTATTGNQVAAINDFIADAQASHDSLIGFGTMHPEIPDINSELDRMISLGLKGIKLHPDFQKFNIDDPEMMPIYKAAESRLPILMHMGDAVKTASHPKRLAKILDMFPKLTVIAAHLGGYRMWNESINYLVGRNVYFDTSSTLWTLDNQIALDIIREHGAQKVLFGSDYPMWTHEEELKRFDSLPLTNDERELILWKNACRLLEIE